MADQEIILRTPKETVLTYHRIPLTRTPKGNEKQFEIDLRTGVIFWRFPGEGEEERSRAHHMHNCTVLCKSNANEFRRISSIVLPKYRRNFAAISHRSPTKVRRHFADSNEISPKFRQHLAKVRTGENSP